MRSRLHVIVLISSATLMMYLTKTTNSYFTDAAQSPTNNFTVGSFPSLSPTPTSEDPTATPTNTVTPTPTPTGSQNQTVNPGDVVINEINWAGSTVGPTGDEWIELRNMTTNNVDISGGVIENLGESATPNITIPSGKSITSLGYFLISNNIKSSSHINIDPDHTTTEISLDNGGEQLRLKTSTNILIDLANGLSGPWFFGTSVNPKKSMERNNTPSDGAINTNWHTALSAINLDAGASESASPRAANSGS